MSTEEAKEIEAREKRKENEKSKKPAQKLVDLSIYLPTYLNGSPLVVVRHRSYSFRFSLSPLSSRMFLGDVDERLHTFRTEMTVGSTMRECIGPHWLVLRGGQLASLGIECCFRPSIFLHPLDATFPLATFPLCDEFPGSTLEGFALAPLARCLAPRRCSISRPLHCVTVRSWSSRSRIGRGSVR